MLAASLSGEQERKLVMEDLRSVFSQITVENMKKIMEMLPGKLDEIASLPFDKRLEACTYLVSGLVLGLGAAGKGVSVGKAIASQ